MGLASTCGTKLSHMKTKISYNQQDLNFDACLVIVLLYVDQVSL